MDDLKLLYRTAGAEGKGITFIFTDNEIKDEAFLEYLNNVLSSGEVKTSLLICLTLKSMITLHYLHLDNVRTFMFFLIGPNILCLCVQVSNLFAKDEMQELTQNLIPVMKKELPRVPPTFDNLYDYFISRSRKNLHVVLCFSPVDQTLYSILKLNCICYSKAITQRLGTLIPYLLLCFSASLFIYLMCYYYVMCITYFNVLYFYTYEFLKILL